MQVEMYRGRIMLVAVLLAVDLAACGGDVAVRVDGGADGAAPAVDAGPTPPDGAPSDAALPDVVAPPSDGGPFAIACNVNGTYQISRALTTGPASYCTAHWGNAPASTNDALYVNPSMCTATSDTPTCTQDATCTDVKQDRTIIVTRKLSFSNGGSNATGTVSYKEIFGDGGTTECVYAVSYAR